MLLHPRFLPSRARGLSYSRRTPCSRIVLVQPPCVRTSDPYTRRLARTARRLYYTIKSKKASLSAITKTLRRNDVTLAARYFLHHDSYHLTAMYARPQHSHGITSSRRLIPLHSAGGGALGASALTRGGLFFPRETLRHLPVARERPTMSRRRFCSRR